MDEEEDDEEEDAEEGYEDMVDQTGSFRHEEGPSASEIEGKRRLQQMFRYVCCGLESWRIQRRCCVMYEYRLGDCRASVFLHPWISQKLSMLPTYYGAHPHALPRHPGTALGKLSKSETTLRAELYDPQHAS